MADGDLQAVITALVGMLSPIQPVREASSQTLLGYANVSGYLGTLLQIIGDAGQTSGIRTSAASQFKAVVNNRWHLVPSQKTALQYEEVPEAEKAQLRPLILGSLMTPIVPVRNLLEDALRTIVTDDYPKNWPTLGEEIMSALSANSAEYVMAALVALRAVLRRYDRVDVLDRSGLFAVEESVFPVLLTLMQYSMANDSAESQEVQLMIIKCLWDGTTYGLPPHMMTQETFSAWMNVLSDVFSQPVPVDPNQDIYARHKLPWWTTKKWVLHLWTRFCSRFLRRSAARPGDDEGFKTWFASVYPGVFLAKTFEGLSNFKADGWPDRLLTSLLDFLHTSLTFGFLWVHIKPHVWHIVKHIFLPLLAFNEEDFNIFEYEPTVYIANQLDPLADEINPRTPALTIIHELIARRDPDWIQELMAWINNDLLQPYFAASAPEHREAIEPTYYAALDIIGNISNVLKKSEMFASSIEDMLTTYVVPVIHEGPAYLRAKACWTFSRFVRIEWNDTNSLLYGLEGMLKNMLEAEELPLVAEAAVGIFDIIPMDIARPVLGPNVPVLVDKYLSLIATVDCDAIVGSLQYLMRYFPNPVKKSAAALMSNLHQAFFKAFNNSNSITDGDDTESHNAYMAAAQTIRAIHTLYKTIRKAPKLYAILEPFVVPILEVSLGKDGNSYLEDGLALMTELTYFLPPPFSPAMWGIFELLSEAYMSYAADYMGNMVPSFDNYISRDKETFLAPGSPYLDRICGMASKYFADPKYPELDLLPLLRVFEVVLLEHIGQVDHIVEPLIKLTVERIQMQCSEPMRVALLEVVLNCMWYNAAITCHVLESNGWTEFVLKGVFDLIVESEFERTCDKKTASLGIGAMLRIPFGELPPYVQEKFLEIVTTYMQLTQHYEDQHLEEIAEFEDGEDEEYGEEDGEEEENGENDEDDWGEALASDDDEDSEDEAMLQQLIAQFKAETTDPEELDADDLNVLGGNSSGAPRTDEDDLPEAIGAPELDEETVDRAIGYGWTLTGQESSEELPTANVDVTVYLAETLHHLEPAVLEQLLSQFEQEIADLYNHLNEVANDRMEKQAFEAERQAHKAEKNADLAAYYFSRKQ